MAHDAIEGAPRDTPHVGTMVNMLRDFTRMNPLFFKDPILKSIIRILWMRSTRYYVPWEMVSRKSLS